ncbi:ArsR/SmtB family transcription factor [Corallincola platygyrae]|uniref:ArsR/SmtB family transcription factor n=1 Tax=Corallincola platygyrae TaxID=1193278 RepID=A0ABW4XLP1_9GAMM
MTENAQQAADFLKQLAHPQRLLILCRLVEKEHTVAELQEGSEMSAPAFSQHLAQLRHAGLVASRRSGQSVVYRIANPSVAQLIGALHEIFCPESD